MATVLTAILSVGGAGAAAPTTLNWHLLDDLAVQDGVLSTQPVPDDVVAVSRWPTPVSTSVCANQDPVNGFRINTWRAVTSVSGAWYETNDQGEAYLQGSAGIAANLSLGPQATLHWFVATQGGTEDTGPIEVPVVPAVVVSVAIRQVDPSLEGDGTLVASGSSDPANLAADQTTGATHHMAGDVHVYEFAIPITWTVQTLATGPLDSYGRGPGLVVDVDVRHDVPCPDGSLETATVAAYSGPGLRPRLDLEVIDALAVRVLGVQRFDDGWFVFVEPQSVWGKYDVANVTVEVAGLAGTWRGTASSTPLRFHEHSPRDPRFGAGPLTWTFAIPADLEPGSYAILARAHDLSDEAEAETSFFFTVESAEDAPLPGLALAGLAFAAALLVSRRR